MARTLPSDWDFEEPQPLPNKLSWTAELDGLDQRQDMAYFVITRSDGRELFAEVHVRGPDWIAQDGFMDWLRAELAGIAATGQPNTSFEGSYKMKCRLRDRGRTVLSLDRVYSPNPFD